MAEAEYSVDCTISKIVDRGRVELPEFTGVRVMMMPFLMQDPASIPNMLGRWRGVIAALVRMSRVEKGVAYLTIDEALVKAGETHRRPGLHVDGVGPNGEIGGWGGGGGYAASGMLTVASHVGCRGWSGVFIGRPRANGDCAHWREQCPPEMAIYLHSSRVYGCGPMFVHESLPMPVDTRRQFCRLSLPSNAPWYDGYTRNPLGIEPTGPIHPKRAEFMAFRERVS